jgi:hypothetical protein
VSLTEYPGFVFTSPGDSLQVINMPASSYYDWTGVGAILRSNAGSLGTGQLKVDLSTPVTAFAALIGINNGSPGSWLGSEMTITASSGGTGLGASVVPTSAHPIMTFVGLVSTTPGETFDSILLTPAVNYVFLDDVRVGSYNAPQPPGPGGEVPEPGTGILALCGAAFLAVARIRKFR